MEDATTAYLARERDDELKEYAAPKKMIIQAAEKMVRHRRAREKAAKADPQRWEHFLGMRLRKAGPGTTNSDEDLVSNISVVGK